VQSNLDKTQASANAGSARPLSLLAALLILAVTVAAGLLLMTTAQGQQIELEECTQEQEKAGECGEDVHEIQPESESEPAAPREPDPAPAPSAPSEPSGETHDYDLESGKGTVESDDGEVEEETLELDLSHEGDADEHGDEHGHDHGDEDDESLIAHDMGLDTVSTTGGGGFAGFGADFLSGDEAVARFAVPPFLIPIYVAAGRAYDVPWNVLAAINQIETDFGRIRNQVSYAGARGWMQFMPGTWRAYGVDASGDGVADPYNPVDAIYAAARYLSASGAPDDLRRAVFAYNHADWYVDRVLRTASIYGSLPGGLLAETGSLAFGRFPLVGRVTYGDDFRRAQAGGRKPQGLWISGRDHAKAVATQNVKVVQVLLDRNLAAAFRRRGSVRSRGVAPVRTLVTASAGTGARALRAIEPRRRNLRDLPKGYAIAPAPGVGVVVEDNLGNRYSYAGLHRIERDARPGARLRGGDVLGHVGAGSAARMLFSVRAAGGAPVDPRPLVDGYRLQEVSDFYHAVAPLGGNPFVLEDGESIQGVSGSARQLAARALSDPGLDIYPAGRMDIRRGVIDRRILAALLYLRRNGLELTVTSLRSGHSFYTAGGGISAHSFGAAVDIAAFNGQPVIGHQGPGSLTEQAIKLLMRLQGNAQPAQLISLMNFGGPSFAMGDHHDHLHMGYSFKPSLGSGRSGNVLGSVDFAGGSGGDLFKADVPASTEAKLSRKIGQIENPHVSRKRGPGALHVEAESPSETAEAEALAQRRRGPLALQPASAGVRVADVDVPARGEAWAVGTVDGGGWTGWAPRQTVLTRYTGGTWRLVGPVRDARGRIANPRLRALATTRGGRGYAVGARGAVVELRGVKAPRLLASSARARLNAVDVRRRGRSVEGFAVGANGTVLRLSGARALRERAGSANLTAVQLEGAGALAAGGRSASGLLRRSAGGWASAGADFGLPSDVRPRITAIDRRGAQLWVAGAISDSGGAGAAELPFAARLSGGSWQTFCAGRPALAAVKELGTPTSRRVCGANLSSDPSDTGAATDVAVTDRGAVVSTARGLHLHTRTGFQPVAVGPKGYDRLALSAAARGWAVAGGGRLAYVRPVGVLEGNGIEKLPLASGGQLAAVAESADGEKLVAIASGKAAMREGGSWSAIEGPVVGLRALAFSQETAWATDETGVLLELQDGRWEAWGESSSQHDVRESLVDALGGEIASVDDAPATGLGALSFAPNGEGWAVGAGGLVIRYSDGDWELQETPAAVPLHAVAATDDVAVAAGDQGVLVEDAGDGWDAPEEPRRLAAGRVFTAVDALSDGSMIAAAGGMVLERTADGSWRRSTLQPLGVRVQRLAGYRADGELRAIALVGEGNELALLRGGTDGWSTVDLPAGLQIADFSLRRDNLQISLIGYRDGAPVALRTNAGAR
jgi:hypothetical protein